MLSHRNLLCGLLLICSVTLAGCRQLDPEKSTAKQLFRDKDVLALVEAAERGDVATIDRLVQQGVDVNARGKSGATPLLRALVARSKKGYSALLKHGADPNLQDYRGNTITHIAAEAPDPFWLSEALEHGADPNSINTDHPFCPNSTPMYYAIYDERTENVKLLIEAGANLNHQNDYGRTPLHIASAQGDFDIVLELLEAGADYRIEDMHGRDVIESSLRGRAELPLAEDQKQWLGKVMAFFEAEGVDLSEKR